MVNEKHCTCGKRRFMLLANGEVLDVTSLEDECEEHPRVLGLERPWFPCGDDLADWDQEELEEKERVEEEWDRKEQAVENTDGGGI